MKRKKLITILFMLLLVGLLLWLDVRMNNLLHNHDNKMPNLVEIDDTLRAYTANLRPLQSARETTIKHESCSVSDEQAIAASKEFIHKIGLKFQGSPSVRDLSLSNIDYPGIRDLKYVSDNYPNGGLKYRFYIGCESGAVENFENLEEWGKYRAAAEMKEPYGLQRTIESIARQIGIPPDMRFDTVEKDWRNNIWIGKFIRTKDGYKYGLDNVAIGISGKSGKFASYKNIYFGQSCPTEVKIKKDEVIKIATAEFHRFLFEEIRNKFDELYERKVQLLIVQPERSENALSVGAAETANPPLKEKPSRLAWVINYNFTGGSKSQKVSNPDAQMSPEERQHFEAYISERDYLLRKYGNPVQSFEMRIDAGNGEILYVSHKNPEYYLKKKNRRCK